jgi:ribosomal protein L44E
MAGAGMIGQHYCPKCEKKTDHNEWWESEFPNQLEVDCRECKHSRILKT